MMAVDFKPRAGRRPTYFALGDNQRELAIIIKYYLIVSLVPVQRGFGMENGTRTE